MKLSFTTMATPELTVRQQAEAAKGFGFHAVDLRMQTGGQEVFDAFFALASDLKNQAGCSDAYIPQNIWEKAVKLHCQKWNIRL